MQQNKAKHCWILLPQGVRNFPTIFGEFDPKDLEEGARWNQNINDTMITSPTMDASTKMLKYLVHEGFKLFKKKAQML